jgi:hypothetical protein
VKVESNQLTVKRWQEVPFQLARIPFGLRILEQIAE